MFSDSLPYLINLIKNNIVLHAIVVAGNWHHIDLSHYDHDVLGRMLIIKNFPLSQADTFEVNFSVKDEITDKNKGKIISLSLISTDPKYFDKADFYFNDDENRGRNRHPFVKDERKFKKYFGVFKIYDDAISPAFVSIIHNPIYGYLIYIRFYTNFEAAFNNEKKIDDALEKDAIRQQEEQKNKKH